MNNKVEICSFYRSVGRGQNKTKELDGIIVYHPSNCGVVARLQLQEYAQFIDTENDDEIIAVMRMNAESIAKALYPQSEIEHTEM